MAATPERDITDEYNRLCRGVGHLFITFARLEGLLSAALKLHLANRMSGRATDHDNVVLSSAIYGSMRFKAARDIIKRIMVAEDAPKENRDFVLSLFEHVGHIENFRDLLAHQQTVPAIEGVGYWQVTDAITTKSIKTPKIYVFAITAAFHAAEDMMTAAGRFGDREITDRLFVGADFDLSPPPWQYRPSMLRLVPQSKGRLPLGPPPPPPPSGA